VRQPVPGLDKVDPLQARGCLRCLYASPPIRDRLPTGQTAGRSITGSTTGSASDGRIRERISEQTRTLPRNPYQLSDRAAQIAVTSAAESVRHERLAELLTPEVERAIEALAGMEAVVGWRGAPRPVHASELLPERALLGDRAAIEALNEYLVLPLAAAGSSLSDTLDAYLDCGGAVETCARQLYVHPNTVRYRLKRIGEITGRDPMNPRDAYVLRIAATVGRLTRTHNESSPPVTETPPSPVGFEPL